MLSVAAIVLTGGTSARMGGADKTAASLHGESVLDRLLADLPGAWPIVCVGVTRPVSRPVAWVREHPPLGGPIAGLAAGLAATDAEILVLLAGDQPFAGIAAGRLAEALSSAPADVDGIAAAGSDCRPQPLLAAYRAGRLREVVPADPRDAGVHRTLASLRLDVLRIDDEALLDVDTPADLARARTLPQTRTGRDEPRD